VAPRQTAGESGRGKSVVRSLKREEEIECGEKEEERCFEIMRMVTLGYLLRVYICLTVYI
jgi:hypothetical protein